MRSLEEFRESRERDEEKTGLDTDHDNEVGESLKHKKKFEAKHKEILEFFNKRKEGAAKIAKESAAKGGPSQLTVWHFKAKSSPYSEVIAAIKSGKDKSYFKQKWQSIHGQIHIGMKQRVFQQAMGELEVWGEAIAEIFKG
jgi:hypothetical protein